MSHQAPQRRWTDLVPDGRKRRKWSKPERKYRLAYRRRPFATAMSTAVAVAATGALAYGTTQVGSIFDGTPYAGSGWACGVPVTWTTDLSEVSESEREAVRAGLQRSFATWSGATGLQFTYAGEVETTYDDAQTLVTPVADLNRNIAVTVLPDRQSTFLTPQVVGFGSPSQVYLDSRAITGGYVGFSAEYVAKASPKQRQALFTHEIGHALGLADSDDAGNVMYRIVDKKAVLSDGDVAGMKAILKPC